MSVTVNYGGGCEYHIFKLVMEPNFVVNHQFILFKSWGQ